ncbi:hypothetical protein [Aquabacterium sp.]|uniref:hypothetical protein n=1 Tax=Aquabacterium sp. TaxID=1872578 RepID=UPI002E36824E|nr:hypothetical protein [Aquabacterium sp.]HEX5311230.1 hypothetical protein [Aquabacterium sp.]
MSTTPIHWLKSALVPTTLAFAISGCSAKAGTPVANESAATANVFAGTYLFDVRDPRSDFGKAHPQEVKRYSSTFNALLAGQVKLERTFVSRITSGPSTQGEVLDIDGQSSVVHVTCQSHRCDIERMGLYYSPASNQMGALLWSHCEETILGSPSATALATLRRVAKLPERTAQDIARCKKVSAAYE